MTRDEIESLFEQTYLIHGGCYLALTMRHTMEVSGRTSEEAKELERTHLAEAVECYERLDITWDTRDAATKAAIKHGLVNPCGDGEGADAIAALENFYSVAKAYLEFPIGESPLPTSCNPYHRKGIDDALDALRVAMLMDADEDKGGGWTVMTKGEARKEFGNVSTWPTAVKRLEAEGIEYEEVDSKTVRIRLPKKES